MTRAALGLSLHNDPSCDPGFLECPKSYVFRGSKQISPQEVQQQLGLISRDPRGGAGGAAARRFLLPVSDCEFTFNAILDDLQKDQWPVPTDHRSERCTGVALSVALALLESCAAQQSGRVLLFTGKSQNAFIHVKFPDSFSFVLSIFEILLVVTPSTNNTS